MTITITGRVVDRPTGAGVAGLWVTGWDRERVQTAPVASSSKLTDEGGTFRIEVEEQLIQKLFAGRSVELIFSLTWADGTELPALDVDAAIWHLADPHKVKIVVEQPRRVWGRVRTADNSLIPGVTVRVYDLDLGEMQPLGQTISDDGGFYSIQYRAELLNPLNKEFADLFVRAFSLDGDEEMLGESEILPEAPAEAQLDVFVELPAPPDLSEYERIIARIAPLLLERSLPELSGDEIAERAERARIPETQAVALWQAARMAQVTGLLAEIFYGLLRCDLPVRLEELLAQSSDEWRNALVSAVEENIIPAALQTAFDVVVQQLERLKGMYTPLSELAPAVGLAPDAPLFDYLNRRGVDNLVDIINKGEVSTSRNPSDVDVSVAEKLEALARLSLLPVDVSVNARLVAAGYTSLSAIARTSRDSFITTLAEQVDADLARKIHGAAAVQWSYLDHITTDLQIRAAGGSLPENLPSVVAAALVETCACKDCENATSPMAYLADLLDYTVRHLQYQGNSVDLAWLENRYYQPFSNLPATCEAMNELVRQVRIAIEVLRGDLRSLGKACADESPAWYVEGAYYRLLEQIGTSFQELREARWLPDERRWQLAKRLGIYDPAQADRTQDNLALLLREPGDPQLTESWLQDFFGLQDTTSPPLQAYPRPALRPSPQPRLLRWRLQYLHQSWDVLDQSAFGPLAGYPIIDPDNINAGDLRPELNESRQRPANRKGWNVWEFLEYRRSWIQTTIADLNRYRQQHGLKELLDQLQSDVWVLGGTGMEGITTQDLLDQRQKQRQGDDITGWLAWAGLDLDTFELLSTLAQLDADGIQIPKSDWDDFNDIIIGRVKAQVLFPIWQQEEKDAGIKLWPDYFQLRPPVITGNEREWQPRRWRSTWETRQAWGSTLRARIRQEEGLVEALQAGIEPVEEALLGELRNHLLRCHVSPNLLTPDRLAGISERLRIDLQAGACQVTTRIAQAIETVQGVLFGARTGLLEGNEIWLDAPRFDEEWRWIGSYATWRAAMQVFLYPENALRPTLRRRQSPGFEALVRSLQDMGEVRPDEVRKVVVRYEEYFLDMCNLELVACAQGITPEPEQDQPSRVTYLVGRGGFTQRYSFSTLYNF